jgi:hypothetical protein
MIDMEHAISRNKVMMVDGEIVIMGRFNLNSAAQEKNVENLLIIRDLALAAHYSQNWQVHALYSQPYVGRGGRRRGRREGGRTTVACMIAVLPIGSLVSSCATGWPASVTAVAGVFVERWRTPALTTLVGRRGG